MGEILRKHFEPAISNSYGWIPREEIERWLNPPRGKIEEVKIKNEDYKIQTIKTKDLSESRELTEIQSVFNSLNRSTKNSYFGEEDFYLFNFLGQLSNNWKILLTRNTKNQIVGWGEIYKNFCKPEAGGAYLTLPQFEGKGIATFLLEKIIQICKENSSIQTCKFNFKCGCGNDTSLRIFEKVCKKLDINFENAWENSCVISDIDYYRIPTSTPTA